MREEEELRDQRRWLVRVILVIIVAIAFALAAGGAMHKAFGAEPATTAPRGGGPVTFDCAGLAVNIAAMADFRDTGAKLEPVLRLARARFPHLTAPELAAFEREIRRLWRERLPADEAAAALFQRCRAQMGDMGRES